MKIYRREQPKKDSWDRDEMRSGNRGKCFVDAKGKKEEAQTRLYLAQLWRFQWLLEGEQNLVNSGNNGS